jgi:hypothetical protein
MFCNNFLTVSLQSQRPRVVLGCVKRPVIFTLNVMFKTHAPVNGSSAALSELATVLLNCFCLSSLASNLREPEAFNYGK